MNPAFYLFVAIGFSWMAPARSFYLLLGLVLALASSVSAQSELIPLVDPPAPTADRLYDFLFRYTPAARGAQDFFRENASDFSLNAALFDVLSDTRIKSERDRGLKFYSDYAQYLKDTFGEGGTRLQFGIDPRKAIQSSLQEWEKYFVSMEEKSISEVNARRLALSKVIQLYGLRIGTTESDLFNPRRMIDSSHPIPEDLEEVRRLEMARLTFQRLSFKYRQLTDYQKQKRKPTAQELDVWKRQMIEQIDEARARNFQSAVRLYQMAHPSFKLKILQFQPTSIWRAYFLGHDKEVIRTFESSKAAPLPKYLSGDESANSQLRLEYPEEQGWRTKRGWLAFGETVIGEVPALPGYVGLLPLISPGLDANIFHGNRRKLYRSYLMASGQSSELEEGAVAPTRVEVGGIKMPENALRFFLASLYERTSQRTLGDTASAQFVNEAVVRDASLREVRATLASGRGEDFEAFKQRWAKASKEATKMASLHPLTLTRRLRESGVDRSLLPLEALEWAGYARYPGFWEARDAVAEGRAKRGKAVPSFSDSGWRKSQILHRPSASAEPIDPIDQEFQTSESDVLSLDKVPEALPIDKDSVLVPQNTVKEKSGWRLRKSDSLMKASPWMRRSIAYVAGVLVAGSVYFGPTVARWAWDQASSLVSGFSASPTVSMFDRAEAHNKSLQEVQDGEYSGLYTIVGHGFPPYFDVITQTEVDRIETNPAAEVETLPIQLNRWEVADPPQPTKRASNWSELRIVSNIPIEPVDGRWSLITPEGSKLKELFLFDKFNSIGDGVFSAGMDFAHPVTAKVKYDPLRGLYWVDDPKGETRGAYFAAYFEREGSQDYSKSAGQSAIIIPEDRVNEAIRYLNEIGMTKIADGLATRMKREVDLGIKGISAESAQDAFRSGALYSYVQIPRDANLKKVDPENPFKGYERFAPSNPDVKGMACYQCDGAMELFSKFLRFGLSHEAGRGVRSTFPYEIEERFTYMSPLGQSERGYSSVTIHASNAHGYVVVRDMRTGERLDFDATPSVMDPRNPPMSKASDGIGARLGRWLRGLHWSGSRPTKRSQEDIREKPVDGPSMLEKLEALVSSIELPSLPEIPKELKTQPIAMIGRTRKDDEEELKRIFEEMESKSDGENVDEMKPVEEGAEADSHISIELPKDPRAEILKSAREKLVKNPFVQKIEGRDLSLKAPPATALKISKVLVDYYERRLGLGKLEEALVELGVLTSEVSGRSEAEIHGAIRDYMGRERGRLESLRKKGASSTSKAGVRIYASSLVFEPIVEFYEAVAGHSTSAQSTAAAVSARCRDSIRNVRKK